MKFSLSAGLLLVGLICSTNAFEWKVCEKESSGLQKLTKVTLSPEPVPAGSTATFTISGTSDVEVEESKLKLSVTYLGLPVYSKTLDRHEHIAKGKFATSFSEAFPAYTPPGHYKVTIESSTVENQLLSCLEVQFQVSWPSFSRAKAIV